MRICLSMIVKNEAPVIERCLASVRPHIHSWAISDTGSTDGTQDIIRRAMDGLPGELIERPWVDFAHNRNEALALARKHGDRALVIDADEILEVAPDAAVPSPDAPGHLFEFLFNETRYHRVALVRLDRDWRWEGVLHEVLVSDALRDATRLPGWAVRIFTDGARSRQPSADKYAADAEVLRRALDAEPGHTRHAFYYAQSLRDAGRPEESLAAYRRRIDLGGWDEELYYSKLQVATLLERLQRPYAEVVAAWLDAYDARPSRAEAPCELARYCRLHERYAAALVFARIAVDLSRPEDVLFVDHSVYAWRARDELSIAAWYRGDKALSEVLCRALLADPALPAAQRERVERNLQFSVG